jgi:SAM-dependent methyltransferase
MTSAHAFWRPPSERPARAGPRVTRFNVKRPHATTKGRLGELEPLHRSNVPARRAGPRRDEPLGTHGLHERFSTKPRGPLRWIFEQLDLSAGARIIELGCGNGALWWENRERIPNSWRLTVTDLSPGMLSEASERLQGMPQLVDFQAADIRALPFAGGAFNAAIANHMRAVTPELSFPDPSTHFGLETGRAQLEPWFASVNLIRYLDALEVTELEVLLAYIRCSYKGAALSERQLSDLRSIAEQRIARDGALRSPPTVGPVAELEHMRYYLQEKVYSYPLGEALYRWILCISRAGPRSVHGSPSIMIRSASCWSATTRRAPASRA